MAGENDQDDKNKVDDVDTTDSGNGDASGDSGTGTGDADASKGDDVVSKADHDAVVARMKAADKRASELEGKVKEQERKDKTELENAKSDVEERDKQIVKLLEQIDTTALENAFLTNNKYSWHDANDALRLLDREGVEVKDGTVTGLAPAIDKLAKAKPHLLKDSDEDDKGKDKGGSSEASGSSTNGKRKGSEGNDKKDYSGRFPALKR